MICQKCGFENDNGAKFCGHCGVPLGQAQDNPQVAQQYQGQSVSQPAQQPQRQAKITLGDRILGAVNRYYTVKGIIVCIFVGALLLYALLSGAS